MKRPAILSALVAALLLLPAAGSATVGAPSAPGASSTAVPSFFAQLDVNLGNLDVVATDAHGHHVAGLERDDFQLFEDGVPVPITHFSSPEPTAGGAAGSGGAAPASTAAGELPQHVIFYIDDFNLRPEDRQRALAAIREFVTAAPLPGADYMVVTYDRALHVRQPFTADAVAVNAALDRVARLSALRPEADRERLEILQRLAAHRGLALCGAETLNNLRMHAESVYQDVDYSVSALSDLVGSLGGIAGPKTLVYVSDGVPMRPAEDLFFALTDRCGSNRALTEIQTYDSTRRFRDLAAAANANRVTFYAFDAAGLRPPSSTAAGWNLPTDFPDVDQIYEENLDAPLYYLASGTGGTAVTHSNDLEPGLAAMGADLRRSYSLGFVPSREIDGRTHRLEVKVDRPDVHLRYRSGYRAETIDQRLDEAVRSALLFKSGGNPLGSHLDWGTESRVREGRYLVPVRVSVPFDRLTLEHQGGAWEGSVRIVVAARDAQGRTSPLREEVVPLKVAAAGPGGPMGDFTWQSSLLMRPGEETVAVGVLDELSSSASFLRSTLQVG